MHHITLVIIVFNVLIVANLIGPVYIGKFLET